MTFALSFLLSFHSDLLSADQYSSTLYTLYVVVFKVYPFLSFLVLRRLLGWK